jgi:hypothetical protein
MSEKRLTKVEWKKTWQTKSWMNERNREHPAKWVQKTCIRVRLNVEHVFKDRVRWRSILSTYPVKDMA